MRVANKLFIIIIIIIVAGNKHVGSRAQNTLKKILLEYSKTAAIHPEIPTTQ